ncbi:FAD-dependent oxidoreductase [Embleya hyalina]|uniref:Putative polyketide hydroxylase n=1 Tax=Embleya hyalina TaxID=516124 RepID=A0A401YPP8_9ACTN|nr:FAD-dependent monooxygenase [Embleya hyalina]GCD96570.1 putative polyketide hydroxylase [Embleya hyalina]
MNPEIQHRVPVLVVGGSLVGLSTSVFLGRLGVPHMLVERHADTSRHPRGRGNNVRTMEVFRTAGVEDRIRAASAVLADNHGILQADTIAGDIQEWLFKEIDPGGGLAKFSPSSWCLCSQNDLEPVLADYARELGGDVRFGTQLRSCVPDEDGVTAIVETRETGQRLTVRADYVVAADGPRSPVREALGIEVTGPGDLFHNVSVTFTSRDLAAHVGERRFIVCYLTNPRGEGALLPVDNREHWVFHLPWHPEEDEPIEAFSDERCVAHIRAAAGVPDLDVTITGKAPWHAAERVAERYRCGRVFLAGDSAHEMSPTGAFGSNTGIQDAHNLAWKLAAVLNGHAGADLLDTYEAERRPVAVATAARASTRSAEHSHPGYAAPTVGGGRQPGVLGVVLGYRYASAAVLGADPELPVLPERFRPPNGEPGTRAPHLWLRRNDTRVSTLDLYETSPVLLVGAGPAGAAWQRSAQRASRRLGVPVAVYRVGTEAETAVVDLVTAPDVDWAEVHGVTDEGAVLVRPDGFVAWRVPVAEPDPEDTLMAVLGAVACRTARGERGGEAAKVGGDAQV